MTLDRNHASLGRNPAEVRRWVDALGRITQHPWTLMEICGGQTHSLLRFGLDTLLPPHIDLIHGPGCPVCVTPMAAIDAAVRIALYPHTIFCTFGDMMRVPGSSISLADARTRGADVRVVGSPLHVLDIAHAHPHRQIVFFAVGFETTAPATAALMSQVEHHGVENISILMSHVRVLPAMAKILAAPDCRIQGMIAAGHVCAVTGFADYHALAERYHVPIVVTGFEPRDLLRGIYHCVRQLEEDAGYVQNAYERIVKEEGNPRARGLIDRYLTICDQEWRGLGVLPAGGYAIRSAYQELDAAVRFGCEWAPMDAPASGVGSGDDLRERACLASEVLLGRIKPGACPHFATSCHPSSPRGAPMVSSEGACAAYYHHKGREASYGVSS